MHRRGIRHDNSSNNNATNSVAYYPYYFMSPSPTTCVPWLPPSPCPHRNWEAQRRNRASFLNASYYPGPMFTDFSGRAQTTTTWNTCPPPPGFGSVAQGSFNQASANFAPVYTCRFGHGHGQNTPFNPDHGNDVSYFGRPSGLYLPPPPPGFLPNGSVPMGQNGNSVGQILSHSPPPPSPLPVSTTPPGNSALMLSNSFETLQLSNPAQGMLEWSGPGGMSMFATNYVPGCLCPSCVQSSTSGYLWDGQASDQSSENDLSTSMSEEVDNDLDNGAEGDSDLSPSTAENSGTPIPSDEEMMEDSQNANQQDQDQQQQNGDAPGNDSETMDENHNLLKRMELIMEQDNRVSELPLHLQFDAVEETIPCSWQVVGSRRTGNTLKAGPGWSVRKSRVPLYKRIGSSKTTGTTNWLPIPLFAPHPRQTSVSENILNEFDEDVFDALMRDLIKRVVEGVLESQNVEENDVDIRDDIRRITPASSIVPLTELGMEVNNPTAGLTGNTNAGEGEVNGNPQPGPSSAPQPQQYVLGCAATGSSGNDRSPITIKKLLATPFSPRGKSTGNPELEEYQKMLAEEELQRRLDELAAKDKEKKRFDRDPNGGGQAA